jgi:hypothetical protein
VSTVINHPVEDRKYQKESVALHYIQPLIRFTKGACSNRNVLLASLIIWILAVSAYDTYLVAIYRSIIGDLERNPVCMFLIRLDPTHLTWFVAGKCVGNLLVVLCLVLLHKFRYKHAMLVATSIGCSQLLLFAYLCLADFQTGLFHFDDLNSNRPERFRIGVLILTAHTVVLFSIVGMWLALRSFLKNRQKEVVPI